MHEKQILHTLLAKACMKERMLALSIHVALAFWPIRDTGDNTNRYCQLRYPATRRNEKIDCRGFLKQKPSISIWHKIFVGQISINRANFCDLNDDDALQKY